MFVSTISPVAFTLGPISVRWYGLLFSGGFILGYFIMQYLYRRKNYDAADLDRLLLYLFIGTIIGARLGHCLIYEPDYYLSHPLEILKIWHGGLASHGGTLGVLVALWLYKARSPLPLLEVTDMLSIPVALVCTFIRVGNFCNSEILGLPTNTDYGVIFATLGETLPRHPAMLYEAAAYFLIFLVSGLIYFKWRNCPRGFLTGLFFVTCFGSRFLIEPFKEEQADYSTGIALDVGQLLSIPCILLGVVLLIYSLKGAGRK